jgi:hypothetical protein
MHADSQKSSALWCGVVAQRRGTRQASSPKGRPNNNPINPAQSTGAKPTQVLLSFALPPFRPLALPQRFCSPLSR